MSETDLELLARYSRQNAEDAFAEIVRRHLGLIYSAALRQVRSPQLAEEVAQSVFLKLARHARELASGAILTAWLYQVARREAVDVVRREASRHLREQIAMEMNAINATDDPWVHIEPFLDEAMHSLDETDRAAVLLRYFENKSLREVGATLGTSDDAAQKRVSRAVERLREFFSTRGIAVGASALALILSANAVHAAPVALVQTINTVALAQGTAASGATLTLIKGTLKLMAWTNTKTAVAIGAVVILITGTTAVIHHHHRERQDARGHFPRSIWTFAGYTNPESAFLTGVWALGNGDDNAWLASVSPDEHARMMDRAARGGGVIFNAQDRDNFRQITGYRIMEKQIVSADEVIMKIYAEGLNETQKFSIQRIGSEWKVNGPVQNPANRAARP
ncbi:MAG TPA: sigma-70 family RNA polymerase sigma factor [Candidatus Limnocylindria bacterium]|nr:sigma-70 family RNA polymerase sigma factor [Candidatus Limnocylindria bacterium]